MQKKRIRFPTICFLFAAGVFAACGSKPDRQKIAVLNPEGQPPQTPLIPMAPRLDRLEGKTIYIVDARYPLTHQLFEEMGKLFSQRYPNTNWIVREKAGTYMDDDPQLWEEIKAKGDGMIIGIGH